MKSGGSLDYHIYSINWVAPDLGVSIMVPLTTIGLVLPDRYLVYARGRMPGNRRIGVACKRQG